MLGPVVDHVAALAERREIDISVVRRVVVAVGCCQDYPGCPYGPECVEPSCPEPDPPAPSLATRGGVRVPPVAIAKVVDVRPCGRPQSSQRP